MNQSAPSSFALSMRPIERKVDTQRILVALDASPQSLAALDVAAALAKLLQAELYGVFVEDVDLTRLCSLPFSAEVGAYSATARALSDFCINREFRALEKSIRLALQHAAHSAGVPWALHVSRGGVTKELLNAANEVMMLSLGRIGWSQRNQMGSTAANVMRRTNRPLLLSGATHQRQAVREQFDAIKVVYTGTHAADRALILAHNLAVNSARPLVVYFVMDPLTDSPERAQAIEHAEVISVRQRSTSYILNRLVAGRPGITVLSDVDGHLTTALIDAIVEPILLVS